MKAKDMLVLKQKILDMLPINQADIWKRFNIGRWECSDLISAMIKENLVIKTKSGKSFYIESANEDIRRKANEEIKRKVDEMNYEKTAEYRARENFLHGTFTNEENIRRIEEENELNKRRYQLSLTSGNIYKTKASEMIPLIKEDLDLYGNCSMSIENVINILGKEFKIFADYSIYINMRNAMEEHGIIVGMKGYKRGDPYHIGFLTFRYKMDYEKFDWEIEGFVSREEFEEFKKTNINCNRIRKIANERKSKDPESLFNNKELVKKIFRACPVDSDNDSGNDSGNEEKLVEK
jgi:hypothetical protein